MREIEHSDIDKLWEWANSSELNYLVHSNPSLVQSRESVLNDFSSSKSTYAVCTNEGDLIGYASFWVPDNNFPSTVEIGVVIGDKYARKKGYGLDIVLTLCEIIFNNYNYHRVTFYTSNHNSLSINSLSKYLPCEGLLRKDRFFNGQYYDTYITGVIREEYIKRKGSLIKKLEEISVKLKKRNSSENI